MRSWRNNPAQAPIASLHYFESVLDELQHQKITPEYWEYVRSRLVRLETLWKDARRKAESEAGKMVSVATPRIGPQKL